jgi:hypothetical protein
MKSNRTFIDQYGAYVWNTIRQPLACLGFDEQGFNITVSNQRNSYYNFLNDIDAATHSAGFCIELVDFGDRFVQNGIRTSYTF